MRKFVFILALAVLAAGCEYDFELKGSDDPDKLFVEMVSSGTDTTDLYIHTCLPTARSGDQKTVKTVLNSIEASSDGKALKVEKVVDNNWQVIGKIAPGSLLKVRAEADGIEPVEGQCRIPEVPNVKKISMRKYGDDKAEMYEVDIDLGGERLSGDQKWAVSCTYHIHYWTTGIPDEEGGDVDWTEDLDTYIERYSNEDATAADIETPFLDNSDYGRRIHIACDDNGSDGHLRFYVPRFETMHELTHQEEYEDWLGTVYNGYDYYANRVSSCTIRVYRVAGEMYSYLKAQDAAENNILALAGLAPAMFAYSNVKGGFGVVAGFSGGTAVDFECN